ncbi:nitric oxide reductase transcriptional regulator NorR [Halomonas caseinilytica]|uniref:nitric oxide reductase transcriptional regulator NorR n=1 Tax=Halomonas caseinilytica TaxID=438744 RepID=UPI000848B134|nr:nitric oxide reductase transcriptional regulator NorR [Halomonas caseinilytica]
MLKDVVLADLNAELPGTVRLQRLVRSLREYFHCGAVGLLRLDGDALCPVAVDGLMCEARGRRFIVAQHPRLEAILARREAVAFPPDSPLPDPYDGLLDNHIGDPLLVHDCMGISLYVEGVLWGALTLDALTPGTFDVQAQGDLQRFTLLAEAVVRMTRLEQDVRRLRLSRSDAAKDIGDHQEGEVIGQSSLIRQLLDELAVVANSELPVLITGETGVGKELFVRHLHQQSRRRQYPLIQVNCAALPESLAESELFGHVKGAFSGAGSARAGRFEAADGGTLFLDEVGELPQTIQAKLLRTLQNGEIQRLGEDEPRHVDVRVIAATNRNLQDGVRNGHFRADLYHRLSVYPVPVPPLRERGNDVLLLAGHFLELNRARLGVRSLRLSPAAEEALCVYDWPGNVRELEHVISRAALKALSQGARREDIVTLVPELLDLPLAASSNTDGMAANEREVPLEALQAIVARSQRQAIHHALERAGGNWSAAARLLEVDASNLHKLARRLGIK